MSFSLFEHNQTAYESAVEMLNEYGKAAVVHPTGTGKSYIGFKLCEQFSDSVICWLSPSEYIYKTQIENLKQDSDGWEPENVRFFTYAKLMYMEEAEMRDVQPDYIVLDEFHRCGAEMWGAGVEKLLEMYPNAKVLGLSATAIRYLDNQRNMVDELFDGNIASEMTLGEAIVRGILNPPKYVLSVFAYQEDYNRLRRRVYNAKNRAVRDRAEQYLESLRRALELADGMDIIFDKHIEDRTGKYIIFCSNIDHLHEMQSNVASWFGKVDTDPHIYTVYADSAATSKEFEQFKQDESNHLKLLFAIDMLNEGVHVENVSGVILFRPTVSPIIYKQQIGRALSASKTKNPIIFDIVNNIENLAAIDTIQDEMRLAIQYYRFRGDSRFIVNDRFEVIDEVKDAKEMFDKLNDTLTASWDTMYEYAEEYYNEHGNLEVPKKYKTKEGYSLGTWLQTQRKVYKGEQFGILGEDRIKKLEKIGMTWLSFTDLSWNKHYEAAKKYYAEHNDLLVPATYIDESGVRLGGWIANLRTYRKTGSNSAFITPDRIKKLDSIGMVWDVSDLIWEQNYSALREYYKENGDINLPTGYITNDGIRLFTWLQSIKSAYRNNRLSGQYGEEQIAALEALGIDWRTNNDISWERGYLRAKEYYDNHSNLDVPATFVDSQGYRLGRWITVQRDKFASGKMKQERIDRLNSLSMIWVKEDPWEERFALAKKYYEEHGNLEIPPEYTDNGIWVSKWLSEQRLIRKGKRKGKSLTDEQIKRLDSIGMRWDKGENVKWINQFEDVKEYYAIHGNFDIPVDYVSKHGKKLADWIIRQRNYYFDGEMPPERIELIKSIGLIEKFEESSPWRVFYSEAKKYYEKNGNLLVPSSYITENGFTLGTSIANLRSAYRRGKRTGFLTEDRIQLLNSIGMVWDMLQYVWERNYSLLKKYYNTYGNLNVSVDYVTEDGTTLYYIVDNYKKAYRKGTIKEEQKDALEKIGIDWRTDKEIKWERGYNNAKKYYGLNGNLSIPASYKSEDGHRTGLWIRNQRKRYNEGKLSDKETELLFAIGFLETVS